METALLNRAAQVRYDRMTWRSTFSSARTAYAEVARLERNYYRVPPAAEPVSDGACGCTCAPRASRASRTSARRAQRPRRCRVRAARAPVDGHGRGHRISSSGTHAVEPLGVVVPSPA